MTAILPFPLAMIGFSSDMTVNCLLNDWDDSDPVDPEAPVEPEEPEDPDDPALPELPEVPLPLLLLWAGLLPQPAAPRAPTTRRAATALMCFLLTVPPGRRRDGPVGATGLTLTGDARSRPVNAPVNIRRPT